MSIFTHFLTGFTPVISYLIFEAIFRKPASLYFLAPVLIIVVGAPVWLVGGRDFRKRFWIFVTSPLLLVISQLLFVIFLQGFWFKRFVVLILSVILGIFLENLYIYHYQPAKYQKYSLANIANYFNLIIIFLFNASLFLLVIFLQFPFWLTIILNIFSTIILTYQIFWFSQLAFARTWPYVLGLSLISAELFWVLSFLPISVYNQALIITLVYYLTVGISRNQLLGIDEKKVIKRYLGIVLVCLIIILLTAKLR